MTDVDFGSFFVQLVTAGNDTTKTMLSSGLLALLQHPEAMAEVRADPALIPGMVEEVLRWANPLHYFRRTATADTELSGVAIARGDKVSMCYTAANRDPAVFADPHRFDIHRDPNPHLSFGIGEHFCLGVHLARLEGRVFFEELLSSFGTIELTGEPVRVRSNLNNALKVAAGPALRVNPRTPVLVGRVRRDVEARPSRVRPWKWPASSRWPSLGRGLLAAVDLVLVPKGTWRYADPGRAIAGGHRRRRSLGVGRDRRPATDAPHVGLPGHRLW